jgi:hypothetical protein
MTQTTEQHTAEQLSNQIVKMLQRDVPMRVYDFFKSTIETDNFKIHMCAEEKPVLEIKDKTLIKDLKRLISEYEYPQLVVSEQEELDSKKYLLEVYERWITEEFGKEYYPDVFECKNESMRCANRSGYNNKRFSIDGIINLPFHIERALNRELIFINEHPKKVVYYYDKPSNQFTRCKLIKE